MGKKINWVDLQMYGLQIGLLELRGGTNVLACIGRTAAAGVPEALGHLGFKRAAAAPAVFVRPDLRLDLAQVTKLFPAAQRVERELDDLRLGGATKAPAPGGVAAQREEPAGSSRALAGGTADRARGAGVRDLRNPLEIAIGNARALGTNRRGDEVYEDAGGRFIATDGKLTREAELAGEAFLPLFLRASNEEQLLDCVDGLLKAAERRVVREPQFETFVAAIAEDRQGGRSAWAEDPAGATERAFTAVLAALARRRRSQEGTSQEAFADAVRLSEALPFLVSMGKQRGIEISWPFALALERVLAVDPAKAGGTRIAPVRSLNALLGTSEETPGQQHVVGFHDLRQEQDPVRGAEACLAERDGAGRTVLWLADRETLELVRDRLALSYAVESAAVVTGVVASGAQGDGDAAMLVVGGRRPRSEVTLPEAARRTHVVESVGDLWAWSAEVLRARARIAEWIRGQQELAEAPADDVVGNKYQAPYVAASKARAATTMVPRALEGATNRALQRMVGALKDPDAVVAQMLGKSKVELSQAFSPEQIDGMAAAIYAHQRDRGFLLADQTGVGKGRQLAGIAAIYARQGFKVIYATERSVNIGDIWRDIEGAQLSEDLRPAVVNGDIDLKDETTGKTALQSLPREKLEALWANGGCNWPEGCNMVIGTFSQFNRTPEDSEKSRWLREVVDENTVLILDESQNVANLDSNIGANFDFATERAAAVTWGSGTHLRDPRGLVPYRRLFPPGTDVKALVDALRSNGEVLQEIITSMLVEDGVMLRREHDLSSMEFRVRLPSEEVEARNRHLMEQLAPVLAAMVAISGDASRYAMERNRQAEQTLIRRGVQPEAARRQTRKSGLTSASVSSPLYNLTRAFTAILKLEDALRSAREALGRNEKPIILLESTFGALLDDTARDEEGNRLSDSYLASMEPLDFRDHLKRALRQLFILRLGENEMVDLRAQGEQYARAFVEVGEMIDELPELPVSPIDTLIEQLSAEGWKVGEVTGRTLAYRGGHIVRRLKPPAAQVIRGFNDGNTDVLVVNVAGCTGVSMHAGASFADRRKRRLIELQAPADPLRQLQGYGRVNRYDQVERPLIETLTTGLAAEMRLLAIRNQKLRRLSANIQSNREHPLLLTEIPDVLNRVGDRVCARYLKMRPELARMLGFGETVDLTAVFREDLNEMNAEGDVMQNTANQMLARCIVLPVAEQERVIAEVSAEFEATVEELDSRGMNPLRARELEGEISVQNRTIYHGVERDELDEDVAATSAFMGPVYVLTGPRTTKEKAADGQGVMAMVEESIGRGQGDGFAPCAERLRVLRASYLRPYLAIGETMEAALRQPQGLFAIRLQQLEKFVDVLDRLKPGALFLMTNEVDEVEARIVVSTPQPNERLQLLPAGYTVKAIGPGEAHPVSINLGRLIEDKNFQVSDGLQGAGYRQIQQDFDHQSLFVRQIPAQVLTGNLLKASQLAATHKLGAISLFRDSEGQTHRGIVTNPVKVNLDLLPVDLPSAMCGLDMVCGRLGGAPVGKVWLGDEDEPLLQFRRHQEHGVERIQCIFPSPRNARLVELLGEDGGYQVADLLLEAERAEEIRGQARPRGFKASCDLESAKLTDVFRILEASGVGLRVAGRHRELVNRWLAVREGMAPPAMRAEAVA